MVQTRASTTRATEKSVINSKIKKRRGRPRKIEKVTGKDDNATVTKEKQERKIHKNVRKRKVIPKSGTLRVKNTKVQKRRKELKESIGNFNHTIYGRLAENFGLPDTIEELRIVQNKDQFCREMLTYITQGKLPTNAMRARGILLCHELFFDKQGVLCKIPSKTRLRNVAEKAQIVIPKECVMPMLTLMHDRPMGAHLGATRLLSMIAPRFYWTTMARDVTQYVTTCKECMKSKSMRHPIKVPMTIRDPAPGPFQCLIIDAMGPMPCTKRGINIYRLS